MCVSVPKECEYVIRNRIVVLSVYTVQKNISVFVLSRRVHLSAKQWDWLSHARPTPFPFPLFLFPGPTAPGVSEL